MRTIIVVRCSCVQKCVCPDFHATMFRTVPMLIHIGCSQHFHNLLILSKDIIG